MGCPLLRGMLPTNDWQTNLDRSSFARGVGCTRNDCQVDVRFIAYAVS